MLSLTCRHLRVCCYKLKNKTGQQLPTQTTQEGAFYNTNKNKAMEKPNLVVSVEKKCLAIPKEHSSKIQSVYWFFTTESTDIVIFIWIKANTSFCLKCCIRLVQCSSKSGRWPTVSAASRICIVATATMCGCSEYKCSKQATILTTLSVLNWLSSSAAVVQVHYQRNGTK